MKSHFLPLALLAVIFVFPVSSFAQPADVQTTHALDLKSIESGAHFTHHLPRPSDLASFASLEDWIKANYNTTLLADSLNHTIQDGRDTISFFTISENGPANHHILSDTGSEFVLQTTAHLKIFTTNKETSMTTALATTGTSASCATGSTYGTLNRCDCVYYVRCLIPSFPSPATYYTEKVAYINTYTPSVGAIAIMDYDQPFGHVGIINNEWWVWQGYIAHLFLSLNEANFNPPCQVTTTRSGQPGQLHIVGYRH